MSEYDDAAGSDRAGDETSGEQLSTQARSESAEAADRGPADLAEAARLLGAGADDVQLPDDTDDEDDTLPEAPADAEPEAAADAAPVQAAEVAEDVAPAEDASAEGGEVAEDASVEDEPAEDEDPIEALRRELRTQYGDWYVVHSYAGYENKVKTNLESRIQSL
ncbi:MAG TPA: hypothetical protein VHC23_00270, partial [Jatrophihabitans sp.]|nr:hypothetical protein [Jatrophihabitans sp.]